MLALDISKDLSIALLISEIVWAEQITKLAFNSVWINNFNSYVVVVIVQIFVLVYFF